MEFSNSETTSIKLCGNNVYFLTIAITSKKVRGNYVGFSTIKITSKKIAEMTGTLVQIWSSTYRQNIHLESTWIRRGVPFREPSEGFEYTPTLYERHGKKYKKNIIIKHALQAVLLTLLLIREMELSAKDLLKL